MAEHIGPWRPGRYGTTVVSDEPTGHDDPTNVDYYGGHLVAESVPPNLVPIVAAAAEMLAALEGLTSNPHLDLGDLVYRIRDSELLGWDGPSVTAWSEAVSRALSAIRKARQQ